MPKENKKIDNSNNPTREICAKYNLSQAALAKRLGIPKRTVESWCMGDRKPPEYVLKMIETILEYQSKEQK